MKQYNFIVPHPLNGERLDKAIASLMEESSRSQVQKAIKNNQLTLNNEIISNLSFKVKENDIINVNLTEEPPKNIIAKNIPIDIVFEDEDLIVINKSPNLTVHPGSGNYTDTLVNGLLYHSKYLSDVGGEIRPGIVHRLDKDTSGLMVVAKNNFTHVNLADQIKSRELKRKYKALVWGVMKPTEGTIDLPVDRSRSDRKKMTTVKTGGKTAVTFYKTLEILHKGLFSIVECKLETGRTHQIRVHLSHFGHSIVGDQTYGNNSRKIEGSPECLKAVLCNMDRQALHSFYISFIHPRNKMRMEFEKDVPLDYNDLIEFIRRSS